VDALFPLEVPTWSAPTLINSCSVSKRMCCKQLQSYGISVPSSLCSCSFSGASYHTTHITTAERSFVFSSGEWMLLFRGPSDVV